VGCRGDLVSDYFEEGLPATQGVASGDLPVVQSDGSVVYETPAAAEAGGAGVVAFTATYDTASATIPNATAVAVATTSSTTTTPYGYTTQAQADAIPVAINALEADVLALKKVVVQLAKIFVSMGVASGA
jgi:hypothetical protein